MAAFLNSRGPFTVISPSSSAIPATYESDVALDIARNFYQYLAADTIISRRFEGSNGNVVLLGLPWEHGIPAPRVDFPVYKTAYFIEIMDAVGQRHRYILEPGLGAAFLYPLPGGRLLLSIWGVDEAGLRAVARLLPLRTGVGQPDMIVVGREASWSGIAGAKVLGLFDSNWRLAPGSFLA